jgi:RNA polymerase sigma-70 factor (ECF subfamily)
MRDMDEYTIREFLARDYPKVVAGVTLLCGSRAMAEDAVQEAVVRAWERSERGESIQALPAWTAVVAANLVRSRFRRLRIERRERLRAGSGLAADTRGWPAGDAAEDRATVLAALSTLSRRQREATVLRYYLDLDVVEVARALGVTEGTAKTTLHRARRALLAALGEAGSDRDEELNDHAER